VQLTRFACGGLSTCAVFLTVVVVGLFLAPPPASAQTNDLTVDVLINSTNTTGYNTSSTSPGEYQRYPERYLEHLQIPYRVIDVSAGAPPDLTSVQLIIAGHKGLSLSAAWQLAIQNAVSSGVGFVNFDSDPNIGTNSHMQVIFKVTGSTPGTPSTSIRVPAALAPGGSTPHYIDGMQLHFPSDPAGDLVYGFHPDNTGTQSSATATLLVGASGTSVAKLGSDPLIIATAYGSGRAVDFTTYDFMRSDRFGFMMGIDDLIWRSFVWAARKPFVVRGYPRFFTLQMDDNDGGLFGNRAEDMFNTALTGNTLPDGTGGPWKLNTFLQVYWLPPGSSERASMIADINGGNLKVAPHGLNGISGGDLYWNDTVANSDSDWITALNSVVAWQQGNGGSDRVPLSRAVTAHYWNISNNSGYDMWNSLGQRYVTGIMKPGFYYNQSPCKNQAGRMNLRPFRIYELPPDQCNPNEMWPIFFADDLPVGSRQGLPSKTMFAFGSQLLGYRFPRVDALWPQTGNGWTVAQSLENFEYYTWRFWGGLAPVEIYTHDSSNMNGASDPDRQALIQRLSAWLNSYGVKHAFLENIDDYLYARNKSLLLTAQANSTNITLSFTGNSTDPDGKLVATKVLVFYGDNEGSWVDVPGFAGGNTYTFANQTPPAIGLDQSSLSFLALPGGSNPVNQAIHITNVGAGTLQWFTSSSAPWLTVSPGSGIGAATLTISANITGMVQGVYNGTITVTALGASNSPQLIPVTLRIEPATLGVTPASLAFNAFQGQGNPGSQTLSIANAGGGRVSWTATTSATWLTLSAASGTAPSSVSVSANAAGLSLGQYTASIIINAGNASGSPQTIPVTLNLQGLLMSDSWSAGTLAGWAVSPLGHASGWTVSQGALQYNGGGHTQLYAGNAAWTDYTLDVQYRLSSLQDYPGGIRGRLNPSNGAGYALWVYPGEHLIKLFRNFGWNIDAGVTQIGQASMTFDTNFHDVKLAFQGTTIQVLWDGSVVISAVDATNPAGMVALDVSNQAVAYGAVLVTGTVGGNGSLNASANSMSFSGNFQGPIPAAQGLSVGSVSGALAWTASSNAAWLSVSPTTGSTPTTLQVTANTTGLAGGNYTGQITLTSLASVSGPVIVPVNLTVIVPPPLLQLTPASMNFTAVSGQPAPTAQSLAILNVGSGQFSWTANSDSAWLSLATTAGTPPGATSVSVNPGQTGLGSYIGHVTVTAPGVANSPVSIPVNLRSVTQAMNENFSDGGLGWVISPLGHANGWSVQGNVYQYAGFGASEACSGNSGWADYTFDTSILLSSFQNYPGGVRGRVNPSTGAGYAAWLYPSDHLLKLFSVPQWNIDGGNTVLLAQAALNFDTTSYHTLRLDFQGNLISVLWDSAPVLSVVDSTNSSGFVCMDGSSQPINYKNVIVTATQASPSVAVSPSGSMAFSVTSNGSPTPQTLSVAASGTSSAVGVTTSASWLTATPSSSVTPTTVNVSVNANGFAVGTYSGTVTINVPGSTSGPIAIPVTLVVQTGFLSVSPSPLTYFGAAGAAPGNQTVTLSNQGTGQLTWTANSNATWLAMTTTSGSTPAAIAVSADPSGLSNGQYSAAVTITSVGASNGPLALPVILNVGTLLFSDIFTTGLSNWTLSPLGQAADWSVTNDTVTYNGQGGEQQQVAGSSSWTDYTFGTDFKLTSLSDFPGGIRGRVNVATGASYGVWVYPAERLIKLFRIGQWSIDASNNLIGQSGLLNFDTTNTHNLRLSFRGSTIQVYYDNQLVTSATDGTYTAGAIAFDVASQPIQFSNVIVIGF